MAWFDRKQLASFAKSALSEAQKTFDKALDINESPTEETEIAPDDPNEDEKISGDDDKNDKSAPKISSINIDSSKLWGSFTGSFFEAGQLKKEEKTTKKSKDEKSSVISAQPSSLRSLKGETKTGNTNITVSDTSSQSALMESSEHEDVLTNLQDNIPSQTEHEDMTQSVDLIAPAQSPTPTNDNRPDKNEEETLNIPAFEDTCSSMSSSRTATDKEHCQSSETSMVLSNSENPDQDEGLVHNEERINEKEEKGILEESKYSKTSHLANMLGEAMHDQERASEESGSSKSYEVVKTSNPTSGHTSGDELETTTTSSDIEVIASPTAQLRATSPNHPKGHSKNLHFQSNRGHVRTGSELSTAGSEDNGSSEVERLLKKISDLTEILDIREMKVVELSKSNLELQEKNNDLHSQVKEAKKINAKLSENAASNEEYVKQISDMERKLQDVLSEKEKMAKENASLKQEASTRKSQAQVLEEIKEKDEIIDDLRREGESLSKQVGKHSELIKKLRIKEKSNEKEITKLKNELEETKSECDRLKKSLKAKDEVESNQIEAIKNLTFANSKWEDEHNKVKSELEDANERVNSLRTSLESAYKEMADLKRGLMEKEGEAQEMALSKETAAKQALQEQLRELQERTQKEKDHLYMQIDDLRSSLSSEERAASRREDQLRRERDDLLTRLEQSETRHEELSGSVSAATKPLLRQIESLQESLNEAQMSGSRVEQSLTERLQQANIQLAAAQERERTAAEQYMTVSRKAASLESKLNMVTKEKSTLESQLEALRDKVTSLEESSRKANSQIDAMRRSFAEEIGEVKREKEFLEVSLDSEKSDLASEKRKSVQLAEQLKDRDRRMKEIQSELDSMRSNNYSSRSSPTLSQLSLSGSISEHYSGNPWPDDVFDASRGNTSFDPMNRHSSSPSPSTFNLSNAAVMEGLQAQLKLREGELLQTQMEMSKLERARDNLGNEVTRLTEKLDELESVKDEMEHWKKEHNALVKKHQTILTMYGEKVEEVDELRMDLADVKEMYRSQIEELVKQNSKQ